MDALSLPAGWEAKQAPDGRSYYVNHNDQSTHWTLPGGGGGGGEGDADDAAAFVKDAKQRLAKIKAEKKVIDAAKAAKAARARSGMGGVPLPPIPKAEVWEVSEPDKVNAEELAEEYELSLEEQQQRQPWLKPGSLTIDSATACLKLFFPDTRHVQIESVVRRILPIQHRDTKVS